MARKVPFLKHSHTLLNDDRLFIPPWVNITAHTPLMLGSWIPTIRNQREPHRGKVGRYIDEKVDHRFSFPDLVHGEDDIF